MKVLFILLFGFMLNACATKPVQEKTLNSAPNNVSQNDPDALIEIDDLFLLKSQWAQNSKVDKRATKALKKL